MAPSFFLGDCDVEDIISPTLLMNDDEDDAPTPGFCFSNMCCAALTSDEDVEVATDASPVSPAFSSMRGTVIPSMGVTLRSSFDPGSGGRDCLRFPYDCFTVKYLGFEMPSMLLPFDGGMESCGGDFAMGCNANATTT